MRATAAEGWRAGWDRKRHRPQLDRLGPTLGEIRQHLGDYGEDRVRIELADSRDERLAIAIALAKDLGSNARLMEDGAELRLYEGPFLLDHQQFTDRAGKFDRGDVDDGPGHRQFEDTDAVIRQITGRDAEIGEGLHQVIIGLAGTDDSDPCTGSSADDTVQAIGAHIGLGGLKPVLNDQ